MITEKDWKDEFVNEEISEDDWMIGEMEGQDALDKLVGIEKAEMCELLKLTDKGR